jgi:hypothetical protein
MMCPVIAESQTLYIRLRGTQAAMALVIRTVR